MEAPRGLEGMADLGYAQRREETARARMPQPTGDHRAPHADAGGGARPGRGLTDGVKRVVGGRDRLGKL